MAQPDNPYAAPTVSLVDEHAIKRLEAWSPGRLQLMAYLNLVYALGSVLVLGLAFTASIRDESALEDTFTTWFGPLLTLLGCYLLLQLKRFAEQRFAAENLHRSVWAVVLASLLLVLLDLLWGEDVFEQLNWQTFGYFAAVAINGALVTWMGIRLRQVQNVYPSFRLMAWLELIGGFMLATVVLVVVAMLPLIGGCVAAAWVFFQAAAEQRRQVA
ncbi:hypothetical protein ACX0MV_10485 [Pseudomonas borbori]